MSEEREVLLVGGPRDGQPVRYEPELLKRANLDLGPFVNTPRTRQHGGRYILRRYSHETGVLELYVWFADGGEVCSHGNPLTDISLCVQCSNQADLIYEAQGGQ